MTTSHMQAEAAVEALLESDESQLYEQLGILSNALNETPAVVAGFDPEVSYDQAAMGPLDDIRKLGRRIFARWEKETYRMLCGGGADDTNDRQAIKDALGIGGTALATYLATTLVATFALAPAVAVVIGAIVVRRYFNPAYDEFCSVWSERIGEGR